MNELLNRILVGSGSRQTLSKYAKGLDRYLGVATVVSAALLGLAVAAPIGASDNFLTLSGRITLFSGVGDLFKGGQGTYAIAAGILFIALPILNISTAFDLWYKHPLEGEKFEKFARRANACGRLWFLLMLAVIGLIYKINISEGGVVYPPIYYLLVSVLLQKIVLTRMSRLAAVVQFVEVEKD